MGKLEENMKVKIGIIGLGNIAQSTYLPLLSAYEKVEIVGAFSPNVEESRRICRQYRIPYFTTMESLVEQVDAVFVHSATVAHYEVVKYILNQSKHVYVDKPLVETIQEAEELLQLAEANGVKLMIGFNRRFAPAYQKLKEQLTHRDYQYLKIEKHRMGLTNQNCFDIILDDYIHLIDTICWLVGEELEISDVNLQQTAAGQLQFVSVIYQGKESKTAYLQTISHRNAGTDLESITLIRDNQYMTVNNFFEVTTITDGITAIQPPALLRKTDYYRRGFSNIVDEFIMAILENRSIQEFTVNGVYAQKIVEQLKKYIK